MSRRGRDCPQSRKQGAELPRAWMVGFDVKIAAKKKFKIAAKKKLESADGSGGSEGAATWKSQLESAASNLSLPGARRQFNAGGSGLGAWVNSRRTCQVEATLLCQLSSTAPLQPRGEAQRAGGSPAAQPP